MRTKISNTRKKAYNTMQRKSLVHSYLLHVYEHKSKINIHIMDNSKGETKIQDIEVETYDYTHLREFNLPVMCRTRYSSKQNLCQAVCLKQKK